MRTARDCRTSKLRLDNKILIRYNPNMGQDITEKVATRQQNPNPL